MSTNAAGAFSFGFVVSALLSPLVGWLIDRRGPRVVVEAGIAAMAAGLLLAPRVREPWQLYATLGLLVGAGGNCLGYTTHALVLSRWFVRRRGLATSVAFSGVGVGSIVVLPGVQAIIAADKVVPHGQVVKLIDLVKRAGVRRFAINVDPAAAAVANP